MRMRIRIIKPKKKKERIDEWETNKKKENREAIYDIERKGKERKKKSTLDNIINRKKIK